MLDIDAEFRKGVLFIRLVGSLNYKTNLKFEKEIYDLIDKTGINNIVLNLYNVDSIDKLSFESILKLKNITEKSHGDLVICNIPIDIEKQIVYQNI